MLLHKRVKSKYSANTRPSAHPSSHSVINISGPLHRFTDNVTQSPREKDPEHTEQMSNSHSQSHFISSQSGKPHRDIGSTLPCHLAGPSTLQRIINTAHKISTHLLRQLRGTHVPKQQCLHRTLVVASEHSNRTQQYHQSSCLRAIHTVASDASKAGWGA